MTSHEGQEMNSLFAHDFVAKAIASFVSIVSYVFPPFNNFTCLQLEHVIHTPGAFVQVSSLKIPEC